MSIEQSDDILKKFKETIKKLKKKNKKDIILNHEPQKRDYKNKDIINKNNFYIKVGFIGKKESGKSFFFTLISKQLLIQTFIDNAPFINGVDEKKKILLYDPKEYNDDIKDFLIKNSSILIYISKDEDYDISEIEKISSQITKLENRTLFLVIHNFTCALNGIDYLQILGGLSKISKEFSFNSTRESITVTYSSKNDNDISFHFGFINLKDIADIFINKDKEYNLIYNEVLILIENIILNNTFYRDYNEYKEKKNNLEIYFQREENYLKIKFSNPIKNLKVITSLNKEKIEFTFSGILNGKKFDIKKSILYMDYPIKDFKPKQTNNKNEHEIEYELLI